MAGRGSYAKGVAKREEILTSALEVIAAHGYRRASVREIAEAVNLSPAGLLHYFESKEELFTAILQARDAQDALDFQSDDLWETFLGIIRHNATVPGLVQLYAQLAAEAGDPEHPAHAYFRERTSALEVASHQAIVEMQRDGEIRSDLDPAWIMRSVHALADGLQGLWLIDSDVDMVADIEQFFDLLRATSPARAGAQES